MVGPVTVSVELTLLQGPIPLLRLGRDVLGHRIVVRAFA